MFLSRTSRASILEEWIHPLAADVFWDTIFEKQAAHFPHNTSLVPIHMEHVVEWIETQGHDEEVIETLRHPISKKGFRGTKKLEPVQYVQEAFLQGHSMVINSLNQWSEPGLRIAKDLNTASDLPVDVYMYLTPPHSRSYGLHSDVMDAFMVQLEGSKAWKVCDVTSWMAPELTFDKVPSKLNASCDEIIMQQGDVMYLPYGTLHQASTSSDYSMHLTVNIERQYYVWLALFFAMIHKVVMPEITVEGFLQSGAFQPDDLENDLYRSLLHWSSSLPMMHRIPGFSRKGTSEGEKTSSRLLLTPLCNEDLPEGYLTILKSELEELIKGLEKQFGASDQRGASKSTKWRVLVSGRTMPFLDVMNNLKNFEVLPFGLEVLRLHGIRHASLQLYKLHMFQSLAAARKRDPEMFNAVKLKDFSTKLSKEISLIRGAHVRAVLLNDEMSPRLILNKKVIPLTPEQIPLALFCLGLYGEKSSQGRPFTLGEVEEVYGSTSTSLLHELLMSGALEVLA